MRAMRSGKLARIFLAVLLLMYGCLFIVLHRMEVEMVPSGLLVDARVKRVTNPFAGPTAGISQGSKVEDDEERRGANEAAPTLYPIPSDWENRIMEGKVPEYQTGKDLWDYTDLPSWMKGRHHFITHL